MMTCGTFFGQKGTKFRLHLPAHRVCMVVLVTGKNSENEVQFLPLAGYGEVYLQSP